MFQLSGFYCIRAHRSLYLYTHTFASAKTDQSKYSEFWDPELPRNSGRIQKVDPFKGVPE